MKADDRRLMADNPLSDFSYETRLAEVSFLIKLGVCAQRLG
jgi:hypothetical protein